MKPTETLLIKILELISRLIPAYFVYTNNKLKTKTEDLKRNIEIEKLKTKTEELKNAHTKKNKDKSDVDIIDDYVKSKR